MRCCFLRAIGEAHCATSKRQSGTLCLRELADPPTRRPAATLLLIALWVSASANAEAGDILRGGVSFNPPVPSGTMAIGNTAEIALLRAREQDVLARTTQALQAVQAMQNAARNLAAGGPNNLGLDPNHPGKQLPGVPNGLTVGGLQIAPGAAMNSGLWKNGNLPTQSTANGQTTVTITQTAPKAILTWKTFNVGKDTIVDFDQSMGTQNGTNNWIVLNRILDPSGVPSQILGSIEAQGQVYLINRNGIIFGGGSQVNVNTLIASALNLPDAAFNAGFLAYTANTYTSSAVFSTTLGNASPGAGNTFPSFSRFYQNSDTGAPTLSATNAPVSAGVVAQPGSSMTTADGGRVILLGAHVKNGGTISTPDGQTILAAGDSAYLYADPTPQMRGLSVDVLIEPTTNDTSMNKMADPTVGTATNSGLISVGKGNATLDGAIIAQNGVINALTGVDFNGSIILAARYATASETNLTAANNDYISPTIPGSVTFGPYSLTQILPDLSDPTTTLDAQGFNPSVVVVQGKTVAFEGASFSGATMMGSEGSPLALGAQMVAPGGTVSITAPIGYGLTAASNYTSVYGLPSNIYEPIYATSAAAGPGARIFIDNGSIIDVSGTQDVSVPVSRNVVAVNLRANELRDSPLQRNGPLYGKTVYVDITVTGTNEDGSTWYGTPFADASGYIALIGRDVAGRTAAGGAINLISAGDVVAVNGSTMNVSGGWLDYQSGIVATTRLVGTDGNLYDIANADPSLTYLGIAGSITISHPRWGVTETFSTPLVSATDQRFEQGYLDGRSAGSIAITANKMILDGTLLGNSVSGPRQRTINANADSSVPLGGSLTFQAPPDISSLIGYTNAIQENLTFVTGHAILTPEQALALSDGTLPLSDPSIDRGQTLLLPVDLFSTGGFTTFSTEASTNIVSTNGSDLTSTKTLVTTSPFSGNVSLTEGVTLDFGTAASATLNFKYDGTVARNADGTISTVSVNSNNSGNLIVDAYGNIDLEGNISAPGGKIAFNAGVLYGDKFAFDASYLKNPPSIAVGSFQGSIPTFNLRGLWTNETNLPSDNSLQPLWINGGSFSLSAPGAIKISANSLFDVTGGGYLPANGEMAPNDQGKGGSLSFLADTDPYLSGNNPNLKKNDLKSVAFDGRLLAYGIGGDGSLALGAGAISFSDDPGTAITPAVIQTSSGPTPGIIVPANLLDQGGFSSYSFASATDLTLTKGTHLLPSQKVLSDDIQSLKKAPSGSDIYTFTSPILLPQFERKPTSLTLTANRTIIVEDTASILADPGATLTLKATPLKILPGDGSVQVAAADIEVLGTLDAPAGNIILDAGFPADGLSKPASNAASNTIYLGPRSVVSAAGASLLTVDAFGHTVGNVVGGGTVSVQNTLDFIAKPGSVIDVSGTEAFIDLATGSRQASLLPEYTSSLVASNGGTISISAVDRLFLDGILRGEPGDYADPSGSVTQGGSLVIQTFGVPVATNNGIPAVIYANGALIITQDTPSPLAAASGTTVPDDSKLPVAGFVTAETLGSGGFDTVSLKAGQFILFVGGATDSVSLSGMNNLEIHTGNLSAVTSYSATDNYHTSDGPTVTLSAFHVWLDGAGGSTAAAATGGAAIVNHAVLNVRATTLDLDGFGSGEVRKVVLDANGRPTNTVLPALPSFGKVNFIADGDLRFVGSPSAGSSTQSAGVVYAVGISDNSIILNGPVSFEATQIYPLSGVAETIVDYYAPIRSTDPDSITFARSSPVDTGTTPLSAGGSLAVYAPTITQGGVIKVPLGSLTLGSNSSNGTNLNLPITTTLTLTPDSVTSVSLDGNVVPYGATTASGTIWYFGTNDPTFHRETVPVGVISLSGANIRIQGNLLLHTGAVINGSGGGDLYAYEFAPGVGGSNDLLDQPTAPNSTGVYAILPGYDQYSMMGGPASVFNGANSSPDKLPQYGQMVHLNGVSGLPAGDYTLLPAHYALLPGAYSVTLASGTVSALAQNVINPVGSYDTLGYFETATKPGVRADGSHNPWQQFLVESGSVVRQSSQYIESYANTFSYVQDTVLQNTPISPLLPEDAGQLIISPSQSLELDGTGVFDHAPGTIGGRVDLNTSRNIAIIGTGGTDGTTGGSGTDYGSTAIVIHAASLDNLNAESVLIGGTRQIVADTSNQTDGPLTSQNETFIVAATSNITVDNDVSSPLLAPEIILSSNDIIDLKPMSVIHAVGAVTGASNGDLNFVTNFDFLPVNNNGAFGTPTGAPGAVVRVSNGAVATFHRFKAALAPVSGNNGYGNLMIESGAQLESDKAILIEGYQTATLATGAQLQAFSIEAAGALVSLGDVPGTRGLTFSGGTFQDLNATHDLTLISANSIDIWGLPNQTLSIGSENLSNLVLDAGQISNRVNGSDVTLIAGNITLQASNSFSLPHGSTVGSLTLNAPSLVVGASATNEMGGQITIGAGTKYLDGFNAITLTAANQVVSQGSGSLSASGSLTINTPQLVAAADSDQQITAAGAFILERPCSVATNDSAPESFNAGLFITAANVSIGSAITMPSGVFTAEARTGNVTLGSGAIIDVSGVASQFFDQYRYAPGGQVKLTADLGDVTFASNTEINVSGFLGASAVPSGGDAGTLSVSAGANAANPGSGVFVNNGRLLGSAAPGNLSGSFLLNAGSLADLTGLNTLLNAGGFSQSRNFRIRTGNVVIGNTSTAHTFILSADGGNIDVQGEIDASGTTGGTIFLAAGGNVTLEPGSLLDAHATTVAVDSYGKPIAAENEAHVEIDTVGGTLYLGGGAINVSVPGFGGDVHMRAPFVGNTRGDSIQVASVAKIGGAGSVDLEAYQTFRPPNGIIDQTFVVAIQSAFAGFSGVVPSIPGLSGLPAGIIHFRPGIEIDYPGDIAVNVMNDSTSGAGATDVNGPGTAGWDFSTWRYNNQPGCLTIRAAGNLAVNNSMSGGFEGVTSYSSANQSANYASTQTTGASWSFSLTSGAALTAADRRQVQSSSSLAGQGNFTLAPDNYIRTGTGDITIAVGGNMTLGNELSTIYTAGIPNTPSNPAVNYNNPAFNPNAPYDPNHNATPNPINFPTDGGNIAITAQGSITAVQTPQLITDWLWRQGGINPAVTTPGSQQPANDTPEAWGPIFGLEAPVYKFGVPGSTFSFQRLQSQTGDYSFAQGIGALGGGNITVVVGGTITDLSLVIPSNGYQKTVSAGSAQPNNLVIQGGGDLYVRAGGNIGAAPGDLDSSGNADGGGGGGVFYVGRGKGDIATVRLTNDPGAITAEIGMDDSVVSILSGGDLKVAPFDPLTENQVFANVDNFSLVNLTRFQSVTQMRSYEFGYTSTTELDETSMAGNVLPAFEPFHPGGSINGSFDSFLHHGWGKGASGYAAEYDSFSLTGDVGKGVTVTSHASAATVGSVQVLPPVVRITAFDGGISAGEAVDNVAGYFYLNADFQFPSSRGTADYLAEQDISILPVLSDADPGNYPTLLSPQAFSEVTSANSKGANFLVTVIATFPEQYEVQGGTALPSITQTHSSTLLHSGDTDPVRIYSVIGSISNTVDFGVSKNPIFEIPKPVWIKAGQDVTVWLNQDQSIPQAYLTQWVENLTPGDLSVIEAGRDLNLNVRVDGPGTLFVQAGRNLAGTSQIVSEGNGDDTALPAEGANLTVLTGLGGIGPEYQPDYSAFIKKYFDPENAANVAENYLSTVEMSQSLGAVSPLDYLENLSPEMQATYVLPAYFNELKMSGRDYNNASAPDFGSYRRGFAAIDTLFPSSGYLGKIDLSQESLTINGPDNPNNIQKLNSIQLSQQANYGVISTVRGGNIELLAPGGPITVGQSNGTAALNSGISTVRGGSISTYSAGSVEVNQSRVVTLGGGPIIIWAGNTDPAKVPNPPLNEIANIDAGKGSKTELVAPPQAFLVDDSSADVGLDPAAVATGNGIATLPAEKGAAPSDIDLIAPDGTVNASDAGIRVSGNFNVAALHVITNGNVAVAGTSVGVPTVVAPNVSGLTAASNTAGASSNAADQVANQAATQTQQQDLPSLITVEVLGYGGG